MTCSNQCQWGTCQNQSCVGSSVQNCGNCGTQTRSCSSGTWSAWTVCAGQGSCSPGQTRTCPSGATQNCNISCQWNACPSCRELNNFTNEQISTSTVICAKSYYGTTLRITGNGINVTADSGYANLVGDNSYLLIENLNNSAVSGLAVIDSLGRQGTGTWHFPGAINMVNSSGNRMTLWAQCKKGSSSCVGLVLDSFPSNNNTFDGIAAVNGFTGLIVNGANNSFKYYVGGIYAATSGGAPICYINQGGMPNTFVLGSCSF